jgi:1,4-alpha-glucan branching enzyme
MAMADKYFSLVLHSHIPYVLAHGSWPHGMDWLFEAAAESYLPLLNAFNRLAEEGIPAGVNIGFTPVLADQLKSELFRSGFEDYLRMKLKIAGEDRGHFERTGRADLVRLTVFWETWYGKLLEDFQGRYGRDLVAAFARLQDAGLIEILTSAATHGYFALLSRDESIRHQVRQGTHTYRRFFGRDPAGFWIPECSYRPGYAWKPPLGDVRPYDRRGVDEILGSEGLGFFFVDSHLLKGGEAKGVYADRFPALGLLWEKFQGQYKPGPEADKDPYLPYRAHPSSTAFFVRDEVTGSQVWSRNLGYPGDGAYLEFHKKHFPGGMRYWRITSSEAGLGGKALYDPASALERIEAHASHFVRLLQEALEGRDFGVVTGMYDTELFGHWWFEGPEWIYRVLKKLKESGVRPQTGSRCLERIPARTMVALPEGSWGQGGFHWIWLNNETSWIWEKIYAIESDWEELSRRPGPRDARLWRQFIREKFLLESSDWPFLISTWSARDYAENRAVGHFERASALAGWIRRGTGLNGEESALLAVWEDEDRLFEEVVTPDGRIV